MRTKKTKKPPSPKIVELPPEKNEVIDPVSVPKLSAQPAAKKIKQKYSGIRRKKALKLPKLRENDQFLDNTKDKKENLFIKCSRIKAKKIIDKYKKMRIKKTRKVS